MKKCIHGSSDKLICKKCISSKEIKSIEQTEHQIQNAIITYLAYKGYYVMRLNSGAMKGEYNGKTWFTKLAPKGTPDLIAFKVIITKATAISKIMVKKTDLLFVEVKKPGKTPTEDQKIMMQNLTDHGARCIVATSVHDIANIL